jgi:hypothetical protein
MIARAVIVVAASALALATEEARAETALEVASMCSELANAPVQGNEIAFPHDEASQFCWGVFAAIQELATVVWSHSGTRMFNACVPTASTRIELIKVFLKYANDHPERLHEPFRNLILPALIEAYPCGGRP